MPLETRKIALSETELHRAVELYRDINPHGFPEGKLTCCRPTNHGLELIFRSRHATRQTYHHTVSRTETMRILIQFCLDHKIPLPQKGEKTLQVEDGLINLQIKLVTNLQRSAARPLSMAWQAA